MPVITRLDSGKGLVKGDAFPVRRTISRLRGDTVTKAKLFVKENVSDADGAAVISKEITTTSTSDGQITDDGDTSGVAELIFSFSSSDTNGVTAELDHYYEIQIHYSDGSVLTEEKGRAKWLSEVVQDDT